MAIIDSKILKQRNQTMNFFGVFLSQKFNHNSLTDESKSERNRTIVMCFLAATAVILMSVGILIPHDSNSQVDIKNWAAIFIEAGIAVFITGVVYYVSNKQQSRINALTKQIKIMVEEQQKFLKEQKEFQDRRRDFFLNMIRAYLSLIRSEMEEYDAVKMSLGMNLIPNDASLLKSKGVAVEQDLKNITFQLTFAADVLEPYHVERIRHLLAITDQYIKQQHSHNAQHHGIIGNIDLLLEELPNPPA